jgi:hypothetical protein
MEEEIHTWQEDREMCLECKRKWNGEDQEKRESQRTKNAYEYVQKKRCVGGGDHYHCAVPFG